MDESWYIWPSFFWLNEYTPPTKTESACRFEPSLARRLGVYMYSVCMAARTFFITSLFYSQLLSTLNYTWCWGNGPYYTNNIIDVIFFLTRGIVLIPWFCLGPIEASFHLLRLSNHYTWSFEHKPYPVPHISPQTLSSSPPIFSSSPCVLPHVTLRSFTLSRLPGQSTPIE